MKRPVATGKELKMDERAREVLRFWLEEAGPAAWYKSDPAFDTLIRERFGALWEEARVGDLDAWRTKPEPCLALLIVLDQFPRNMFRDSAKAFASDPKALDVAVAALLRRLDRKVEMPGRQFFYLPLMHSETAPDQDRAVRLFVINEPGGGNLDHARAHRHVIRSFGRFPYRNEALGRRSTPGEIAFIEAGGYGEALREVTGG